MLDTYESSQAPDGTVYKACGTRRASVCPACAETYRTDAYMLLRGGLAGLDAAGVPDTVAAHPLVFLTLTAPGFGAVHAVRTKRGKQLPCRARRDRPLCPHGRPSWCTARHRPGERLPGQAAVSGLLRLRRARDLEPLRLRTVAAHHDCAAPPGRAGSAARHGVKLRVSFGKVAEYQARGVVHYHALIRLDAIDAGDPEQLVPPPACITADMLADLARQAATSTTWWTPPHPDSPGGHGWPITWGAQLDARPVRDAHAPGQLAAGGDAARPGRGLLPGQVRHQGHRGRRAARAPPHARPPCCGTPTTATPAGSSPPPGASADPPPSTRQTRHGRRPYDRLRAWAHMLGFGGHFLTKSRRYSTTFAERRQRRADYRRRHHVRRLREERAELAGQLHDLADEDNDETTLVIGTWTYAGSGWLTNGDQLLALAIAAETRERREIAREEMRLASAE